MREVVLRVPARAVEEVLDRLLPIIPSGVREVERGRDVELRMRGPDLPPLADVVRAAGRWRKQVMEHQVPDDWRERRVADYEPLLIGGRLVVRPAWAPESSAPIEISLGEGAVFGGGSHPTTSACLELLLELEPLGAFADLGCGTGVLALLAEKLGWAPVVAVDLQPSSVTAALANAATNDAQLRAYAADLSLQPPPSADGLAANVPAALHECIAAKLASPVPRIALVSGFGPVEAPGVLGAYAARGMRERRVLERHGWTIALLEVG